MSADELAEAEEMARYAVDRRYPLNHEYLVPVMAEYDRRGEKIEEMREKLRDIEMLEAQGE